MSSALLALFSRALREDVRSKAMYWARAGLVAIVLLNLLLTQTTMRWAGAPGLVFFNSIAGLNLFFISLAGLSYFASAITEEKEDMTLGLLRMTNLNPLSILLGKSASRQIGALLLLISQVPFTLLAVSLGGINLAQIIAAYASLAGYVLFLGNLALFFSVVFRRSFAAAAWTAVTLFVFLFGSWILRYPVFGSLGYFGYIVDASPDSPVGNFLDRWTSMTPTHRLSEIGVTGFNDGPICFQVVSNLILAAGFFLLAWSVFDLFCGDVPDAAPSRGLLARSGKRRRLFGPGRPWRRAIQWKDYFFLGGGHFAGVLKLLFYAAVFACIGYAIWVNSAPGSTRKIEEIGGVMIWGGLWLWNVEVSFVAARIFRQERVWKTWSSLSTLPFSHGEIARQKIIGCILATWPALAIAVVGGFLAITDVIELLHDFRIGDANELFMAISGFAFAVLLAIFYLHFIVEHSLRLKWGAWPLATALTGVGLSFTVSLSFFMFREATFVVLDVVLLILIGLSFCSIARRLEKLAAED